jgi:hypothetical protein
MSNKKTIRHGQYCQMINEAKIHRLKKYMAILVVGRDIFFKIFRKRPGYYCYLMKTLLIGHF